MSTFTILLIFTISHSFIRSTISRADSKSRAINSNLYWSYNVQATKRPYTIDDDFIEVYVPEEFIELLDLQLSE